MRNVNNVMNKHTEREKKERERGTEGGGNSTSNYNIIRLFPVD